MALYTSLIRSTQKYSLLRRAHAQAKAPGRLMAAAACVYRARVVEVVAQMAQMARAAQLPRHPRHLRHRQSRRHLALVLVTRVHARTMPPQIYEVARVVGAATAQVLFPY